jgi:hypothetical protein
MKLTCGSLYHDMEVVRMTQGIRTMTMQADVVGNDVARANDEVTHGPMRRFDVAPSRRSTKFGSSTKFGASTISGEDPPNLAKSC